MVVTDARLLSALGLRARVSLKRGLQRLGREHGATCAFLWSATSRGELETRIEYAGDPGALPGSRRVGSLCAYACEQRTLRCADGEEREVVLLGGRMCTGAPTLLLGLVDSRAPLTDVLSDGLESTLEQLEHFLVDSI